MNELRHRSFYNLDGASSIYLGSGWPGIWTAIVLHRGVLYWQCQGQEKGREEGSDRSCRHDLSLSLPAVSVRSSSVRFKTKYMICFLLILLRLTLDHCFDHHGTAQLISQVKHKKRIKEHLDLRLLVASLQHISMPM